MELKQKFLTHISFLLFAEPFLLDGHILDEVQPPRAIPVAIQELKHEFKTVNTQYYLNEFSTVYEQVGLAHNELTPPQSPPNHQPLLANLEPLLVQLPFTPHETKLQFNVPEKQLLPQDACNSIPISMDLVQFNVFTDSSVVPTYDSEMDQSFNADLAVDELEELVRTTAEDMQWSSSSNHSTSSNHSSSPGSPGGSSSSNFGDCSSDDPEWIPETIDDNNPSEAVGKMPRKRRAYIKGAPEEKKVRKKEQNKNAATRYRMKKKAEVEVVLSEERELAKHHDSLETQIVDLQREIKYLKGLMRDLFKAKGLIN